jgi:hypothetical protein
MQYFLKVTKVFFLALAALLIIIGPLGGTVHADIANCDEGTLRNLGVVNLTCAGDQTCTPSPVGSEADGPDTAPSCTCSISDPDLLGNDNPEKAFRYFLQKGLSPIQAAGILGNMLQESGVDPEKIQGGKRSPDPHSAGSKGWGIIQWTPGAKVINIAKNAGITTPINDLGTQLEIVWWHMTHTSPTGAKNMLAGYQTKTTIADAVNEFEEKMEGAGKPAISRRIAQATNALAKYGGTAAPAGAPTTPAASGCGDAGQFIDGFTVYSQYDPKWKDKPYASSTVGESGCGPSAMAMIITALTGTSVTPDVTAAYAGSIGMYVPGAGSSWDIAPRLAQRWQLKAEPIGANLAKITAALGQGKLVITSGKGAKPFTSGGHYIVIRGITPDGKFKIGDSGHTDTSDKEWDPNDIIPLMNGGSVYAISK